jgi:signal-transduction protein with cAMP-binding, CBS, and nucleotidyltransferase domain
MWCGVAAAELPVSLRSEVSVTMHRDIIQKVPLFQHCSAGFLHSLISYLQPQIYSPRDVLVREGDVGHEMYFIRKGKGESVSQSMRAVQVMS